MRIKRRKFLKNSALLGATGILSASLLPKLLRSSASVSSYDLLISNADNIYENLKLIFEELGGIEKFVKAGQSVGFLVNSPWTTSGNFTNPSLALSAIRLFKEAGAGEIIVYKPASEEYWSRSNEYEKYEKLLKEIKYGDERVKTAVPGGKNLKEAEVYRSFLESDVFISIPVAKHHNGTVFSGNLKGLMGVSSSDTNRLMHSPDRKYTYGLPEYLAQCIVDLNLIRKPDLCIVDAIVCSQNNGPRGPSDTVSPNKIIAGTDPLACDIYSCELIGFYPDDVLTNVYGYEAGLGEKDLSKLNIKEV